MKIALIQCPEWSTQVPPYNLALLSAILQEEGHSVFCYDFNIKIQRYVEFKLSSSTPKINIGSINWYDKNSVLRFINENNDYINQLINEVLEQEVDIVGFTIYDTSRWFSEEISSRIKERVSSVQIIFGGASCFRQGFPEEILKNYNIDAVCLYEGEMAFKNFVSFVDANKEKVAFLPGVVFRSGDGKIINGGREVYLEDLSSLPFADFSDFDLRLYDEIGLSISTSRGCVNRCLFCEESVLWGKYRNRKASNIYAEIVYQLNKYPRVDYIFFNDSLINGNMRMLSDLVDLIIGDNLKFRFAGQATISEELSLEFLKKMRKAGLSSVSYGLESISSKILELIGKRFSPATAEKVIRDTKRAQIDIAVNVIVGFPGETWDDVKLTASFLQRNLEFIDIICIHPLVLMSDSPLFDKKDNFKIVVSNQDKIKGWFSEEGTNDFKVRLEKLKFLEEFLAPKASIAINNFDVLNQE